MRFLHLTSHPAAPPTWLVQASAPAARAHAVSPSCLRLAAALKAAAAVVVSPLLACLALAPARPSSSRILSKPQQRLLPPMQRLLLHHQLLMVLCLQVVVLALLHLRLGLFLVQPMLLCRLTAQPAAPQLVLSLRLRPAGQLVQLEGEGLVALQPSGSALVQPSPLAIVPERVAISMTAIIMMLKKSRMLTRMTTSRCRRRWARFRPAPSPLPRRCGRRQRECSVRLADRVLRASCRRGWARRRRREVRALEWRMLLVTLLLRTPAAPRQRCRMVRYLHHRWGSPLIC